MVDFGLPKPSQKKWPTPPLFALEIDLLFSLLRLPFWSPPRRPKRHPRAPQEHPKRLQDPPRAPQEAPRGPQERPRRLQEGLKRPQEPVKRAQDPPRNPKRLQKTQKALKISEIDISQRPCPKSQNEKRRAGGGDPPWGSQSAARPVGAEPSVLDRLPNIQSKCQISKS